MIRWLCIFLLGLSALAWAGPEDILKDYLPQGKITRFEGPITIWLGGKGRLEGQYYVETVVNELQSILPHVSFSLVSSPGRAGIRVHLTDSQQEWEDTIRKTGVDQAAWQEHGPLVRGLTWVEAGPEGKIARAEVVLHLDFQTSGGQKLWVVRHEFMHALGIMGHPQTLDTVLNSRQMQYDKNSLFSDSDIFVLQTLYGKDLKAGSSWQQCP